MKRLPIRKRVQYQLEYRSIRAVTAATRIVPMPIMRRIGAGVGWLAFRGAGLRRRVAEDNIRQAFPSAEASTVRSIGQRAYMNLGRSIAECAAFSHFSESDVLGMVDIEGLDNLDAAYSYGRGVILYSGHFGNWELLGAVIARCGYPIHATDTNHSNKHMHRLVNDARRRQGMHILPVDSSLRMIVKLLRENQGVTYLADQDRGAQGIFVDFFGRPASTLRGPAVFAIRCGCPILPGFLVRVPSNDRHRAIFEKPILPDPDKSGEQSMRDITQRFTSLLEDYVRRYPDHYLWGHRRWKSSPPPGRVIR